MPKRYKILLGSTMTLALLLGFLDPVWPDAVVSLKRLHIFLFNLCVGGFLIIYYTEGCDVISNRAKFFLVMAYLYTLTAASGLYIPTLILSIPLWVSVEAVRIKNFSFLPMNFLDKSEERSRKFNHASLLCLSMGIVIASLVILNNEYLKFISLKKLTLDIFFLGYSFPISLITMAIMFSYMSSGKGKGGILKEEFFFWMINLGVIIFFMFIIFDLLLPEFIIATLLFFTVSYLLIHFLKHASDLQQKSFIASGMFFLFFTGLTGVLYISNYFFTLGYGSQDFYLTLHAMVSLYGWNLSGLFIIIRWHDFPIKLHSIFPIMLHWLIVFILAPIGKYHIFFAFVTVFLYVALLGVVFFSPGTRKESKT